MMNKKIFEKNIAELVVTNDMTVAEAKVVRQKKQALVNKVQKLVVENVREMDNREYAENGGYFFEFPNFKLKTGGTITVKVMFDHSGWGDFGNVFRRPEIVAERNVKMSDIMK